MILESIVVTRGADGRGHVAPMGVREEGGLLLLAPFRPSTTLANLERDPVATINFTDDVRVFAGSLTGRRDWPTVHASDGHALRLDGALTHLELELERHEPDDLRPRFWFRETRRIGHAPFAGFNRAQAAVVELAILVSRLGMIDEAKVDAELAYLEIAIEKTAGPRELEAWEWLVERVRAHRRGVTAE